MLVSCPDSFRKLIFPFQKGSGHEIISMDEICEFRVAGLPAFPETQRGSTV